VLEHLCRCVTRPAITDERDVNHAGHVALNLKTPYCDGTTHIVMSPLEFMQRLASLAPRPRQHLTHFHGALAPNAGLRAAIVPSTTENSKYNRARSATLNGSFPERTMAAWGLQGDLAFPDSGRSNRQSWNSTTTGYQRPLGPTN
jgi:Putative transposase